MMGEVVPLIRLAWSNVPPRRPTKVGQLAIVSGGVHRGVRGRVWQFLGQDGERVKLRPAEAAEVEVPITDVELLGSAR